MAETITVLSEPLYAALPNEQFVLLSTIDYESGSPSHAIYGRALLAAEASEGAPLKLSCMDIEISMVRDAMFYGSRISVAPEYEYDKRAAEKLDAQVLLL
ncbi:hypothetical protein [Paenibacillus rigui]|uniref:Uncharacterized protein n=1 Tax=Paenibacillus rigui TaxID=554312 RepID=A0A229URP6_9BACL|nr:hypothetical protein [Paenibacillus rigui]OXM86078.1 hypothetical protein CF651_12735 [Paenibacillus rigui]